MENQIKHSVSVSTVASSRSCWRSHPRNAHTLVEAAKGPVSHQAPSVSSSGQINFFWNHFGCSEIRVQHGTLQGQCPGAKQVTKLFTRVVGHTPELLYFLSLSVLLSVS